MTWKNTADRWGPVSQLLHWLIVILILGMGTVGLVMTEMRNSPDKIQVYLLHKSFGITVLALVTLRLLWRLYAGTPRPVPGTPHWQERIAALMHAAPRAAPKLRRNAAMTRGDVTTSTKRSHPIVAVLSGIALNGIRITSAR